MRLARVPAEEEAVRRFVERLWLPYHRELERTVQRHALADRPDEELIDAETAHRREWLADDDRAAWVAIPDEATVDEALAADDETEWSLLDGDKKPAGFVTTEVSRAPPVFDAPDRLVVGDLSVREPHRGTGLADALLARAAKRAEATDCERLALDVDVDNERALGFYERLGFTEVRRRMEVSVSEL